MGEGRRGGNSGSQGPSFSNGPGPCSYGQVTIWTIMEGSPAA